MELTVLGSSSKGNCYIIQNDVEAIVLECGVPLLEVKKALNFKISKVVGCLVSHEHGDHFKYVNDYLKCMPVFASTGTIGNISKCVTLKAGTRQALGSFTILPFDVKHDAAEPMGFLIKHPEIGVLLFATDTYFLPYTFAGLTNILIEANYRMDLLQKNIDAGLIPAALRDRTLQSHMSYDTCKDALLANDLSKVNNIVLLHLSDNNSHAEEFRNGIHQATGKRVHIADKGLKIKLNKHPF